MDKFGKELVELVGSTTLKVHGTVRVAILQCELCHVCFLCKSKSFLDAICREPHAGCAEDPTLRKVNVCADAQLSHAYIPFATLSQRAL